MEEVLDHLEEEGDGPLHLEGEGVAIKPDSDDEESLEEVLDEESKVGSNTCLALQPFSAWWTTIKEQAEKCDFTNYDEKANSRDAILFQTSNI